MQTLHLHVQIRKKQIKKWLRVQRREGFWSMWQMTQNYQILSFLHIFEEEV